METYVVLDTVDTVLDRLLLALDHTNSRAFSEMVWVLAWCRLYSHMIQSQKNDAIPLWGASWTANIWGGEQITKANAFSMTSASNESVTISLMTSTPPQCLRYDDPNKCSFLSIHLWLIESVTKMGIFNPSYEFQVPSWESKFFLRSCRLPKAVIKEICRCW